MPQQWHLSKYNEFCVGKSTHLLCHYKIIRLDYEMKKYNTSLQGLLQYAGHCWQLLGSCMILCYSLLVYVELA
jgi:hypothetical protein